MKSSLYRLRENLFVETAAPLSRRKFIKYTAAAGVACGIGVPTTYAAVNNDMMLRPLGNTGEKVSAIGLGGYHIGNPSEEDSLRLIRAAIDRGITFLDNCWDYHDGGSEIRMGKALRDGYRNRVFLMSKIDGHTRQAAARQIDESLKRLQTDHVDLMQFHEVIRPDDPKKIFAEGGSMEAMMEAKKAGKVRFIGFTGHKDPAIHLSMLDRAREHKFHFDAVQMPLNVMDAHFKSFEKNVLPVLVREKIGVLGMKPLGSGRILKSKTATPIECLHYALSLPTSVVITGMESTRDLDQAIEAVRTFHPLKPQELATLLDKTRDASQKGEFEQFKTTTQYDGTVQNPQWLG
jgi:aryl-alcohol dehydrogenase-like predicted oxidoreductase